MYGLVATLVFVFGLMGWFGIPIYLTIAVMPVLLTATGVTNDIYVFSRYFNLLREKPGVGQVELLRETFDKMASPVANTSLTTSAGFFSFAFSPLGPVLAFGICSGIGVLFGLVCSFTVLPALLRLVRPEWFLRRKERRASDEAHLAVAADVSRRSMVLSAGEQTGRSQQEESAILRLKKYPWKICALDTILLSPS